MESVKTWLRQLLSGKDNSSPDTARVMGWISFIMYNGLYIVEVAVHKSKFDAMTFAGGLGVLFTTIGLFIGLKKADEPECPAPAPAVNPQATVTTTTTTVKPEGA